MTDQKPMEFSDINSDGPELSCQYIDGVIKRFPESKPTMEYIRTINAQLRHDRDGYAEMYKELRAENERLKPMISERFMVDLVTEWKHFWMNQTQNNEQDRKNYFHRAFGVDANMKYDLANRIVKALRGADEKD